MAVFVGGRAHLILKTLCVFDWHPADFDSLGYSRALFQKGRRCSLGAGQGWVNITMEPRIRSLGHEIRERNVWVKNSSFTSIANRCLDAVSKPIPLLGKKA